MTQTERRMLFDLLDKYRKESSMMANLHISEIQKEISLNIVREEKRG